MVDELGEQEPLNNIARGLFAIARAIDRLGTANAATPMGAIELLANEIKELPRRLGEELYATLNAVHENGVDVEISEIGEQLKNVAEAIRGNDEPWES